MNSDFLNELLIDYIIKEERSETREMREMPGFIDMKSEEDKKLYTLTSSLKKYKDKEKENLDLKLLSVNFSYNNLQAKSHAKACLKLSHDGGKDIIGNINSKETSVSDSEEEVELIKQVKAHMLDPITVKIREDTMNEVTSRIVSEIFNNYLQQNPPIDIICLESYINKRINKEKSLTHTCLKSIINSCSVTIMSSISSDCRIDMLKDKRDSYNDFSFLRSDYEILGDIYSIYKALIKSVMMQLRFIFEAPFSIFNSQRAHRVEVNFEDLFRDLFFNRIFSIPLTCLYMYAENSTFESTNLNISVKKLSDEITKLLDANEPIQFLYDEIKIKRIPSFNILISRLRKSTEKYKDNQNVDIKFCLKSQDGGIDNCTSIISVNVFQKEKSVPNVSNVSYLSNVSNGLKEKKIPEYSSLDELCDFINSTDVSENKSNCGDVNNSCSKIRQKKVIKNKVTKSKSKSKSISKSFLASSIIIDENQVEEFKKFITKNKNTLSENKKIKPKLSREWVDSLRNHNF